jgi:hypothetical protein
MAEKLIHPRDLWPRSAFSQAEPYDFSENIQDSEWDFPFELTEKERDGGDFQPMMNYLYPLPDFEDRKSNAKQLKKIIGETSLTLIKRFDNEEYYLALTGGGMNMSWAICDGYIKLGYLPPLEYCDSLPEFAGEDYKSIRNQNVLFACQRTATIVKERGEYALKSLQAFVDKAYGSKWRWKDE